MIRNLALELYIYFRLVYFFSSYSNNDPQCQLLNALFLVCPFSVPPIEVYGPQSLFNVVEMELKKKEDTFQDFKIGSVFSMKVCHSSVHLIKRQ